MSAVWRVDGEGRMMEGLSGPAVIPAVHWGRALPAEAVLADDPDATADPETHYWTGDAFDLRPALPDLPAEVEAGAQIDVGGFPVGAAVMAQIGGVEADAWVIGADGRLNVTLGDAGAWEITVGEVFPTQARVYQISVIEPAP